MRVRLQLSLPATPALLGQTRQTLRGYLQALDVDHEIVSDVVLAVDEACANVIRHAATGPDDEYELRAEFTADSIEISIDDQGPGFDPEAIAAPALTATSGRGLQIIEQLMSDVQVGRLSGAGTRLHMQRLLR